MDAIERPADARAPDPHDASRCGIVRTRRRAVAGRAWLAHPVRGRLGNTFLDATQVHAVLSVLFAPAEWVFGLQGFSVADIEALQFTKAPSPAGGKRWVLLYAATMLLLVILPRIVLAGVAHWRARRLAANFPLDLEQPYFSQFRGKMGGPAGVLRVLPYSFTLDEARDKGLNTVAAMLLGDDARLMLRPSTHYGDEPREALADTKLDDPNVSLAVLFNLAATPEKENHGAFIEYLMRASPRGIAVLVDESSLAARLGEQAEGKRRVEERIALWQQFCGFHHATITVVNLLDPQARPLDQGVDCRAPHERAAGPDPAGAHLAYQCGQDHAGEDAGRHGYRRSPRRAARDHGSESHPLLASADGDALLLWDTPGFGDSVRLARRLAHADNPIGWLLREVVDRYRDRPFWLSQQALRTATRGGRRGALPGQFFGRPAGRRLSRCRDEGAGLAGQACHGAAEPDGAAASGCRRAGRAGRWRTGLAAVRGGP